MDLHGVKQAELATAVGVTQGAVSGWCGGAIPKGDQLYQLAQFFGVSMESMLAGAAYVRGVKQTREVEMEFEARLCESAPVFRMTDPRERELRAVLAELEKLTAKVKSILEATPGVAKKVTYPKGK
jgi:transcriptional regulator with XRE-family HTH domain